LPSAAALVLFFLPGDKPKTLRLVAFLASLFPLVFTLVAWGQFDLSAQGYQFVEKAAWYPAIGSSYHLGVDGLSLPMVLLTTILTPLAILASGSVKTQIKSFLMLFLFLETGMLGVFLTLDLMLFFVFWEIGLIPMYFIINQWGGENRNYASLKFILYTMAGSLGLLLAIQMMGAAAGTFDLVKLTAIWPKTAPLPLFGLTPEAVKAVAFWAFVIAFAIKVPVWPFHTWLPDAHTEAPTPGSMILAGVLLKLGAYGFLRLVLPLYPVESHNYAGWLALLAAASIIFGALGAFGQNDFKRLVAYSSVNHMGFVVLGVAAAAWAAGTPHAIIAVNGAVLQMFNHGLSAAGMFFLVGVLYERAHIRDLTQFGGLFAILPIYGGILLFTAMGSLGLPGMGGFISEFLVVRGAWSVFPVATILSMIGLFFTGAHILKALKMVLQGPLNERWSGKLPEMRADEIAIIAPLMILMLANGIWPAWLLEMINKAAMAIF
ncbi:MAG TPA: NADH-quinone oxidoreductase subunit M, partial [Leptolinea sp.]